MTHKLLVGAALAVTAAPLVRQYSLSLSTSGSSNPSSPSQQPGPAPGPAAVLRQYARRVIRGGE
jgi:hypothetical protein